jgi:integrase
MAKFSKNGDIDTKTARARLAVRGPLYWTVLAPGRALGYRKGATGGRWQARIRDDKGGQHFEALGAADDILPADGVTTLSFQQAQERARDFFKRKEMEFAGDYEPQSGPYTVALALEDYFKHRERRGSRGVTKDRSVARVRIIPTIGDVELSKLTTRRIRDWHTSLADAPRLARKGRFDAEHKPLPTGKDEDSIRARRATANRTLTVLKAALNHAFHEGKTISDDAWRKVKPFREADAPVVRFLSPDETRRLLNACDKDFRSIVRGALVTGCRYGELTRMAAGDFNAESKTVTVRKSKAGKPRHVALTDEGSKLFAALTNGKTSQDHIFLRDDGEPWGASHQKRRLEDASDKAKLDPPATFHILRHSYASALAIRGVPMGVIAASLGHADTRMTERHYAHLSPNYVADTIRANLPMMGEDDLANTVVSLTGRK